MTSTTTVFVVDLVCLSCGRSRQLTVATLTQLPPPEICSTCRGSVLAEGWSSRIVRAEAIVEWAKLRAGRPPAQPKLPLPGLEAE